MEHDLNFASAVPLNKVIAVNSFAPNAPLVPATTRWQQSVAVRAEKAKVRWAIVLAVSVDVVKRQHYGQTAPLGLWLMQLAGFGVALIRHVLFLAPLPICAADSSSARRREAVFENLADTETSALHVRPNVAHNLPAEDGEAGCSGAG